MTSPRRVPRVAIFNHKGGVGKTTLTVNIAAALALKGKSVLLVDSDPQCNLTSQLFEESVVDSFLEKSDSPTGGTIWSAVKPLVDEGAAVRIVSPYETNIQKCFIVPGDIQLSQFEIELTDYWTKCKDEGPRGFNGTAALSTLIDGVVNAYKPDYVFYDTGPNIGPLNRAILLDCDYFIIPGACDLFSVRALKTLGHTLCKWIKTWQRIKEFAPKGAKVLQGTPALLGYIPQGFRVYGQTMTRLAAEYRARFEKQLYRDIISPLRKIDPSLAKSAVGDCKLGEVKDFGSLVQLSQQQGVPLWKVYGGVPYQLQEALAAFTEIAAAIIAGTR